jgi:hypothetical protein
LGEELSRERRRIVEGTGPMLDRRFELAAFVCHSFQDVINTEYGAAAIDSCQSVR